MVILYSGTPGSGKSCHQAEDIREFLNYEHGCIIANYAIDESKFKGAFKRGAIFVSTDNEDLTPEHLIQFSKMYFKKHKFKEGAIRLYIDECQIMFNNREWDAKGRKKWISFFTQHRKYGYDIYLISQFDRMIDRQIRSLIEYEVKHRRLSNAGAKGILLDLFFGGRSYLAVKYWYPMHEKLGVSVHHIRKKYYSLYDSYKDFGEPSPEGGTFLESTIPEGDKLQPGDPLAGSACKAERSAVRPEISINSA